MGLLVLQKNALSPVGSEDWEVRDPVNLSRLGMVPLDAVHKMR